MDPQAFIRLSIGSLGIRLPETPLTSTKSTVHPFSSPCVCEIRLRGFPVQTTQIPFLSSPEANPNSNSIASSFYLEESDLKAMLTPGCFYTSHACLEVVVFTGRKGGTHCGVGGKRHQIGVFKLNVGPEWGEGKPVILFNGWIAIGKSRESGKPGAELHLRVKLDPDPRYVFQFEDETKLSPQIVQLQGNVKQPIFSCKFSRDRVFQVDPLNTFWSNPADGSHQDNSERRERKGWKVKIHDLSGSAVAAAFITTPFVPSTGCDWVAKSNPGAWLIVHHDVAGQPDSWHPWGKLEAWREKGIRDSICLRFHVFSEGQEGGERLMSEILINAEKGGEFFIDTDRQMISGATPLPSPQSSGDYAALNAVEGGFVMRCRVQGEGKCSKPLLAQLAMRHVTCVEDAAIFMALAAAVDLSIEACKPFRRRIRRGASRHSW